MEQDEKVRIIETAIQAEKETLVTYIKSATKISNVVGKNMFLKLALDEIKHREILEKALKSQLEEGKCFFPMVEKREVTKIVPDIEQEIEKTSYLGQDDLAILMLAQKVEKSGIDYYKNCIENSWDEEAKKMFSYLLKMEEEHFALIQAQIDYIEGTGYWLGIREFTLDD